MALLLVSDAAGSGPTTPEPLRNTDDTGDPNDPFGPYGPLGRYFPQSPRAWPPRKSAPRAKDGVNGRSRHDGVQARLRA
jgi:hypothetical protein